MAGASADQWPVILLAALTGAFVAAGANAINDYFDAEIDAVNRPDRPIPSGKLQRKHALTIWGLTSLAGMLCGWFTGPIPFAISVGAVALLYVYSRWLKSTPLLGNILVGFMTGLAFIFGAVAVGFPEAGVMPFVFAFLSNLAREVIKDIEDREGDARSGAATFPLRFGVRRSRVVVSGVLAVLIASTFYAYRQAMYGELFLWIVIVADAFLAYAAVDVWRKEDPKHMRLLSNAMKAAMVVGLAALYVGRI